MIRKELADLFRINIGFKAPEKKIHSVLITTFEEGCRDMNLIDGRRGDDDEEEKKEEVKEPLLGVRAAPEDLKEPERLAPALRVGAPLFND